MLSINTVQSNPVNTDAEGAIESVRINRVCVLSGLNLEKNERAFFPHGQRKLSAGFAQVMENLESHEI